MTSTENREIVDITDATTGSSARIAPRLGFNCFEFHAVVDDERVDVLDASPQFAGGSERPSGHGIPLLFPFPNRIRGGRYSWRGTDYHIPPALAPYDGAGNAIHGFCLDRPWRVKDKRPDSVTGVFQLTVDAYDRLPYWPADFLIEVTYSLRGPALRADIRIENPEKGETDLPWGFGTHPYFKLPLGARSKPSRCLIEASAAEEWELDHCLPTGRRLPVTERSDLREGAYFDLLKLDDVLTGIPGGNLSVSCSVMDEEAGLQVTQSFDRLFREIVVYTPPNRNAICLEPYTCVTDAVNLAQTGVDTGWRVLGPGGEFRTWIEISAANVLA